MCCIIITNIYRCMRCRKELSYKINNIIQFGFDIIIYYYNIKSFIGEKHPILWIYPVVSDGSVFRLA